VNPRRLRASAVLAEARGLGVDLADLLAVAGPADLPTVTDWVAEIDSTFTPATARTYRPYWNLAVRVLGDRLAEVTTVDLATVVRSAGERARTSHPEGSGRSAEETCVAALRALCARAIAAGHLTTDPAAALAKPRRSRSRRRALDDHEIANLADAVRLTSRDPDVDLLIIRFHLETGARRQGALSLRLRDVDPRRSTVWLREKHGDHREQPASPSLVAALGRLHRQRTTGDGSVTRMFLGPTGSSITARHYDTLFARVRSALRWDARTPVSAHVLRHTAITNVARLAGYAVAQTFAGHTPPTVTGRYIHATLAEVAAAVAALTDEPHPLAVHGAQRPRCCPTSRRR